jgi:HAD superfamily hydrolase (TIGR01458 family)
MGARRSLLVDIDGVLTTSWRALPGAAEALRRLRSLGVPLAFVTNTTSRTRAEIAALLVDAGFEVKVDDVLTTAAVTAAYLRDHHRGARVALLNSGDISADFDGVEIVGDGGDVVVLGGAGPEFSYEAVNRAFSAVDGGAPLVVMNPNLVWRTQEGLQLDTGAYLVGLEAATGVRATVTGKPSPDFFAAALSRLGADAATTAMVGDDLVTDVLGAQACGLHGVLVRTGKFRQAQLDQSTDQPEVVVDSFADVPGLLDGIDDEG